MQIEQDKNEVSMKNNSEILNLKEVQSNCDKLKFTNLELKNNCDLLNLKLGTLTEENGTLKKEVYLLESELKKKNSQISSYEEGKRSYSNYNERDKYDRHSEDQYIDYHRSGNSNTSNNGA